MKKKWMNLMLSSLVLGGALWSGAGIGSTYAAAEPQSPANNGIAAFTDMPGHWADDAVAKWQARGIVQGSGNGKFEPNRELTRSEWVALVNRTFQLQKQGDAAFSDVKSGDWFADDVLAAQASGYIQGFEDGSFKPGAPLTREQAAVTLTKLLKLQVEDQAAEAFKDDAALGGWSKQSVYAAVNQGIIKGYEDHTFRPDTALTRAEAVTLLDRAAQVNGSWYGEAGVYGPEIAEQLDKQPGNVIVNAAGVTLRNMDIAGDLIIGKGVGEGDVTLSNVTVHGNTYVFGGGEHSIHLNNSVLVNIIVNKQDGSVRLVAKGSTAIQEVVVQTGANLETEKGVHVSKVSLSKELPANSQIRLAGYFDTVNVEAYSLAIDIPEGAIGEMNVAPDANGVAVDTGEKATIESIILNAVAKITGLGTIQNATVNAAGSSFDKAPAQVKIGEQVAGDATITIGGKEMKAEEAAKQTSTTSASSGTPSSGTPGGGSSSGSGGSNSGSTGGGGSSGNNGGNVPSDPSGRPSLSLEREAVSVGEAVYFTSSQNGTAYLASADIAYYQLPTLQLAVESGEALKLEVQAGKRSYFDTTLLNNVGFPRNYEFNIAVYNGSGSYGAEELVILDESESLTENPVLTHYGTDPEYFSMDYNRLLQLAPGQTTEAIVELALNGTDTFEPFTASLGTVEVRNNRVIIRPAQSRLGKDFKFRLRAGSVVTSDGQSNVEYGTGPIDSFVKITLLSHGGGYSATVKAGEEIQFSVEDAATIYLIPSMLSGSQDTFDKKVDEGFGKKVEVTEAQIGQPVTISTADLSPGDYSLHVWGGHSISVKLTE